MAAWLDLMVDTKGWALVDTGRLETLVTSMGKPRHRYPSIIYFVGGPSRYPAMRALFPHNNVTRRGPSSFLGLHLSTESANNKYPVLFAEGNFISDVMKSAKSPCRWPNKNLRHYPMSKKLTSVKDIYQRCISDFLLPWTQVICFFVENLNDTDKVRQFLDIPRLGVKVGSQTLRAVLQVIVVIRNQDLPRSSDELKALLPSKPMDVNVTIMDLRERAALSPTAELAPLRHHLLSVMTQTRSSQVENGLLFSAEHLCVLWNRTLRQGLGKQNDPVLDCLAVARESKQLNIITSDHIIAFLKNATDGSYKHEHLSSSLASAFLMNAYSPGMHGFRPEYMFKDLYDVPLREALKAQPNLPLQRVINSVLKHFVKLRDRMGPDVSSSDIRLECLLQTYNQYGGFYTTTSCFCCLSRYPEHTMPCHHAICDTCVIIIGKPSRKAEYEYIVERCPLCDMRLELTVCQLPPTKRPVILSLDGGGIRGIIQLGLLNALERRTGSLREIVDLHVGTSVGALNAMNTVFNNISAADSFETFPSLARQIFSSSHCTPRTTFPNFRLLLRCLAGVLSDGQYDDGNLESILKSVLGQDRRIFDVGTTSGVCKRIAIITSQISDGKACVLANYRGVGIRSVQSAYRFLVPQAPDQNPFLWEVARCSVAAPWFFRTKSLPGFGPLQDGGVRANNPLSIALKESAIIWPRAEQHDILISLGTGCTDNTKSSLENQTRSGLSDTAVPRLIRAAMASPSMDGEQGFCEALNFVPYHMKNDIYRLDHVVPEGLPRLDDVDQLMKLAESDFCVSDSLVRALLVTGCFFFELDQEPVLKQGVFHCEGSILCKSHDSKSLLERIHEELPGAQFRVSNSECLGPPDEHNGCLDCGYYRKKCIFTVNNLDEMFTIELSSSCLKQKVGGFPKSVRNLLNDQQTSSCFGRADHQLNSWPPPRVCFCNRGTRRKVHFLETDLPRKRQRC